MEVPLFDYNYNIDDLLGSDDFPISISTCVIVCLVNLPSYFVITMIIWERVK